MESEQEDAAYLSEGDETVTLSEIVAGREGSLREEELWALCRECCLTLEFVHSTQELFQSLVITPETVAFDREGNVCFLDLDADPDPLYIPPEVAENGCTYESHLFSLGMTLLYAVEYSSGSEDSGDTKTEFSEDLNSLLTHLTQDDAEERPSLELVLELCDRALQDASSQEICQNFACVPVENGPQEEGSSLRSVTEELAAYLQNQSGLVTNSDSDSSKTHSSANSHGGASATDTRPVSQSEHENASGSGPQPGDRETDVLAAGDVVKPKEEKKEGTGGSGRQQESQSPGMEGTNSTDDSSAATPRRGRRRQGLLLSDILDVLGRYLQEAELWAMCRESVLSLQRKKKHLPAYISLDTLMVRENGCVSYKAIPEDKPLEVMYMAPELQQKGILNEKTCLYGLGITLRCAAGQKHNSSVLDVNVGAAFEELLSSLLQSKPEHRPSLETTLLACDEYEKQSSITSRALLQEIYMDASALLTGREQKKAYPLSSETEDSSVHTTTELQTSWTELDEMEREAAFPEDEIPAPVIERPPPPEDIPSASAFKPIAADLPVIGSAFKPVAVKPKLPPKPECTLPSSDQKYPSAFKSSATHFKPIILHKSEVDAQGTDRGLDADSDDKEKNVVKKLKEIKKNLLKHRPPGSLSKDVESDDSKPPVPVSDQRKTPKGPSSSAGSRKSSGAGENAGTLEALLQQLQNSGQMPETKELALAIAQHLQSQLNTSSSTLPSTLSSGGQCGAEGVNEGGQSEGGVVAQPALSGAGQAPSTTAPTLKSSGGSQSISGDITQPAPASAPIMQTASMPQPLYTSAQSFVSGAQFSGTTVTQSVSLPDSGPQSQPVTPREYQSLPQPSALSQPLGAGVFPGVQGVGIPPISQAAFFGQTPVSVPVMQYGGGPIVSGPGGPIISGPGGPIMQGPVQYQLQQDPRTGLVQLVPVSMVPYNAQPGPSRSPRTLSSDLGFAWQQPYPVSPVGGYLSDPQTTEYSAAPRDDEGSLPRVPSKPNLTGRNAKGLIQKTAAQRARNTASASASPTGYHSDSNINSGKLSVYRPVSDNDEGLQTLHNGDRRSKHRRSNTEGAELSDSESKLRKFQGEFQQSGDQRHVRTSDSGGRDGVSQPYRTSSQSSSPSPSKDSGICLTGNGAAPQVTEASLMERLLSSDSLKQQQVLARVLHILHKGLVHEGHLDSFQSEEVIAEYIVSLAHLKWDTFMSAITEKYTDIHWSRSLLANLYHAVNGQPPPSARPTARTPPASRWKPLTYNDQSALEQDLQGTGHTRRRSEPGFHAAQEHDKEDKESVGGQSVVRVLSNGRYVSGPSETSDSTDNESQEKRRRFKKRYELDRNKSTSLHALPGNGAMALSPDSDSFPGNTNSFHGEKPEELYRGGDSSQSMFREKASAERSKGRKDMDLYSDCSHRSATSSPSSSSYIPSSYHSLPRQPRPQHGHDPQHQRPRNQWQARPSPVYSPPVTSLSRQSSLPGSADTGVPPNSVPLPMLEGRDFHGPPPRGPHGVYPQTDSRSLNTSSAGSNNSYSPALRRKDDVDSSFSQTPQHQYAKYHATGNAELRDSYIRPTRDSEGRPPKSANLNLSRNSDTSYSPSFTRNAEKVDSRLNSPLSQSSRQLSPSQTEVNNNLHKLPPHGVISSGVTSPKSETASPSRRTQHASKPRLAWGQELGEYRKKGQVVYHSAMIQLNMTPEIDRFIHEIDEDNKATIESRLSSVEQEIAVQRRQRKKSQTFYKKLTEPGAKQAKGDKGVVSQVLKDMSEMTNKLRFLDLCRTHLQMLLAELYGLDTCFLHTLVSGGGGGVTDPQPLVLQPFLENQLLQFQTVRERSTGCEVQVLQAGHPHGLLAYLFTLSALSDGYIHQFLFCFRYFLKAEDVFNFITQKYIAAKKGNPSDVNIVRVQQRAMDLLQFWVEGFYSVDFERNEPLSDKLEAFVMQRVEAGVAGAQNLLNLVKACHLGENTELVGQPDVTDDQDEVYYLHLAAPKRWESFRSLLGRKKENGKPSPKESPGVPYKDGGGVMVEKRPPSRAESGSTLSLPRRSEVAQLMDYAPHRLAEQLTLMEQELFQRTHPVHYLDSKAQGVGVDMSIPSLRTPSMARKKDGGSQSSLFVGPQHFEPRVSDMISHAQEITHWVSAEILSCGSQKAQIAILSKFLTTAQLCVEIRNFATALAIVAGLDNLLVRQLPAWKHLPAKSAVIMEELEALQVQLKGEQMALMRDKDSHIYPTIPCALYFMLHLQQLEIGGFTLANGMYKWAKMRSICQMVDQIRIFREHEYGFEPDYELQSLICRRLHELSDRDLHTVAAAHDNNFRRSVSGSAIGFQGTWRKVKVKLQSKNK